MRSRITCIALVFHAGTALYGEAAPSADAGPGTLAGSPASPGTYTGIARVVMEPAGARLEPGEILVAPSTDPGWTPLFLTAGALVMEMGGMMSHGAVVAREYGLPAVVGVPDATSRISTGDWVTVDGAAGSVVVEPAASMSPRLGPEVADTPENPERGDISAGPVSSASG